MPKPTNEPQPLETVAAPFDVLMQPIISIPPFNDVDFDENAENPFLESPSPARRDMYAPIDEYEGDLQNPFGGDDDQGDADFFKAQSMSPLSRIAKT